MNASSVQKSPRRVNSIQQLRPALLCTVAGLFVAACGGGGDGGSSTAPSGGGDGSTVPGFVTPFTVQNASSACSTLKGLVISASSMGEPTTGAVVASATYKTAVPDKVNSAGTAINQATPDYCELQITIKPVDPKAPNIYSQVNLPTTWNGKALQFGGGGYNGALITGVQYSRSATPNTPFPLTQGYVTAGTDSGHQNVTTEHAATFALNDEALTNFAYAAYKKTHDVVVTLTKTYYGNNPKRYYYMGGSQGGREGMRMAQQYPQDYDGIVAIDPVMPMTALWNYQISWGAVQSTPGSWLGNKIQLLHNTVAAACDALDGIADQVVSNYKACTKDVAINAAIAKRCASGTDEGSSCFSDGQLTTVKWMYNGMPFPYSLANGVTSYAGYTPGGEGLVGNVDKWLTGTVAPTQGANPDTTAGLGRNYLFGSYYARYFVTKDPNFNALNFDPANYKSRVQDLSNLLDSANPDLTAFYARGGKLILRENIADKGNSSINGLNYWDNVAAKMGKDTVEKFFLAYVATGLFHTSDGVDAGAANAPSYGIPGHIDLLGPLDDWVEKGIKPADSMVLTNTKPLPPYDVIASKPMCRYPTYPKFVGSSPAGGNLASNYVCASN
jgi:hypothetical protein